MFNEENNQFRDVWKGASFVLVGLILVSLVLGACARQAGAERPRATEPGEPNAQGSAEGGLANTKWRLISFGTPGAEMPVIKGSTITLEFNSTGQAGGTGGCNSYGAQYEVQKKVLSFDEIRRTMMACGQEDIGRQEQDYLLALESAGRFVLSEDRLTIWYDDGRGVLNWVKSDL